MLSSFIPAAIFEILLKHVRRPILGPLWRVQDMAESNFCDHRNQLPCRMIRTLPVKLYAPHLRRSLSSIDTPRSVNDDVSTGVNPFPDSNSP